MPQELGRALVVVGAVVVAVGLVLMFADRIPFVGRLPGDILIKKKNFTLYFPLATGLVLSLLLTLVLSLWSRR